MLLAAVVGVGGGLVAAWGVGRGRLPRGVPAREAAPPDLLGSALVILAISALSLGVVKGDAWQWDSTPVIACYVLAATTLVVFVQASPQS